MNQHEKVDHTRFLRFVYWLLQIANRNGTDTFIQVHQLWILVDDRTIAQSMIKSISRWSASRKNKDRVWTCLHSGKI